MQETQQTRTEAARGDSRTLAIASIVLGILSLLLSVVVIGAVFGALGLICAGLHVFQRRQPRRLATVGFTLSLVGLVLGSSILVGATRYLEAVLAPALELQPAPYGDWVGQAAPDFEVETIDGERIRMSDLKGQRVILYFFATWCAPCVSMAPDLHTVIEEEGDDLVVLAISSEPRAVLRDYARKTRPDYTLVSVSRGLPEPFDRIRAVPTLFFLDRKGIVEAVRLGRQSLSRLRRYAATPDGIDPALADLEIKEGDR